MTDVLLHVFKGHAMHTVVRFTVCLCQVLSSHMHCFFGFFFFLALTICKPPETGLV